MIINSITVIGANGTIGSQVAGLLAAFCNAKVFLVCRTYEKSAQAIEKAMKSVRADSIKSFLIPKTYDELGDCIQSSDWVFESVVEDMKTKLDVNKVIAKYRKPGTIVSTGTSGLSVEVLAAAFDEEGKALYFGTHFFNPPYSLPLLEFVTTDCNNKAVSKELVEYLQTVVRRKVICVKDKAGFLGNRIGFLFMNKVAQYAETYKDRGGIDYIDSILGCFTGRAMPPLETIDFVGLDVHKAIVDHLHECEPAFYSTEQVVPSYILNLIQEGRVGRKVGAGLFNKDRVYDITSGTYRQRKDYSFTFAEKMIEFIGDGLYQKAFHVLASDSSEEAEICRFFLNEYVTLSQSSVGIVAQSMNDADIAMCFGFNWAPPSTIERLMKYSIDNDFNGGGILYSIIKYKRTA